MRLHVCPRALCLLSARRAFQQEPRDEENVPIKTRTGRLLGRCHAALGEHKLSVSVLDAALARARDGQLLYSEGLTVRARAMVGKEATLAGEGNGPHWNEDTGRQRLQEMLGRMVESGRASQEKLLLDGLT